MSEDRSKTSEEKSKELADLLRGFFAVVFREPIVVEAVVVDDRVGVSAGPYSVVETEDGDYELGVEIRHPGGRDEPPSSDYAEIHRAPEPTALLGMLASCLVSDMVEAYLEAIGIDRMIAEEAADAPPSPEADEDEEWA